VNNVVTCQFCKEQLSVGQEARAVVALCIPEDKRKKILTCDSKQWGSAATRFECESQDGRVRHVVQTDPSVDAPHEMQSAA
jgi:hypothetical protein